MQGQDDDASSLEDDHAPRSTPGKVEFQVGNYCVVNYEEELWSNNENHLKQFDPCQVLRESCSCWRQLEVAKENKITILWNKAQHQHTRRCTWIHQKSCCTDS